ncbi:Ubiquitin-conjugating enzyme E2-18 kDa [Geodia barretti]|uniref:Ubiquitin-conjugating enzyme E2-18 kDa n=1 Tax=Geodia barretti TaxID=519541 RepID=A0AA35WXG6_GEOBA|nr:Ubiquitin-conjugating enzyme E2-18 kDa [Geodia barretti]
MASGDQAVSLRRLKKEYQKLSKSPPAGVAVSLPSDTDMYVWEALLNGPDDSVYKGTLCCSVSLPPECESELGASVSGSAGSRQVGAILHGNGAHPPGPGGYPHPP